VAADPRVGVAVFVVSSIIHMTPLWHKTDYPRLATEDRVLDAAASDRHSSRRLPHAAAGEPAQMRSPEFQEKMKRGPAVILTVLPPWTGSMARNLVQWFVYCLVVGVFAHSLRLRVAAGFPSVCCRLPLRGDDRVPRLHAGAVADVHLVPPSWAMTLKSTFDGVIFALVTCAVFTWMWPR